MQNLPLWPQDDNPQDQTDKLKEEYRARKRAEYAKRTGKNPNHRREKYAKAKERDPEFPKRDYARRIERNPDHIKQQYARTLELNPDFNKEKWQRVKERNAHRPHWLKHWGLKFKYGISLIEWYMLLEWQGYNCALCGKPLDFRYHMAKIAVDHNHSDGKVRGLIHMRCNTLLGLVEDHDLLQAALSYIQSNGIYSEFKGFTDKLGAIST